MADEAKTPTAWQADGATAPVSDEALRREVRELAARLPASHVREAFELKGPRVVLGSGRLAVVRQTVIEYLNDLRPHRARRLFTMLFESLLISDPVLLRAGIPVPGTVQRVDVGALWLALSRLAFPELTIEAQQTLTRLARHQLIDDVLASDEAAALQERLRVAAVRYFDRLLVEPEPLRHCLSVVNQLRHAEIKKKARPPLELTALDRNAIVLVREVLLYHKVFEPLFAGVLGEPWGPPPSPAETDAAARTLINETERVRELVRIADAHSRFHLLLPLSLLHLRRHYLVVARWLVLVEGSGKAGDGDGGTVLVAQALVGHFIGCCRALTAQLILVLRLGELLEDRALRPPPDQWAEAETLLARLGAVLPAVVAARLYKEPRWQPMVVLAWDELLTFLWARVVPLVEERLKLAVALRYQPLEDHQAVVALLRLLVGWVHLAKSQPLGIGVFHRWPERKLEDLKEDLMEVVRLEPYDDAGLRLAHLLRLEALAHNLGGHLSRHLPLSSHSAVAVLAHRLDDPTALNEAELEFYSDAISVARKEVARSRQWQSPELVDLIARAEARGIREPGMKS